MDPSWLFNSLANKLLNYVEAALKDFLKPLDRSSQNIHIFAGEITLLDLHLTPDALALLDLPVTIESGVIREVKVKVPWLANLGRLRSRGEKTSVAVSGISVVASMSPWDEPRQRSQAQKFKQRAVALLEQAHQRSTVQDSPSSTKVGWGSWLVTKILDNLELKVSDVHLQLKQATAVMGVQLASLSYSECNAEEEIVVHTELDGCWAKQVELGRCAVYCDCLTESTLAGANAELNDEHDWIVSPFNCTLYYAQQQSRHQLHLEAPSFFVSASHHQIREFLRLTHTVAGFEARNRNLQLRPHGALSVASRWQYFGRCLRQLVPACSVVSKLPSCSLPRSFRRWRRVVSRECYRELYMEALRGVDVDLEPHETKLSAYVIFKARQRARRQLEREKEELGALSYSRSWFGIGILGGMSVSAAEFQLDDKELEELDQLMDEEDRVKMTSSSSFSAIGSAEWCGSAWMGEVEVCLLQELRIRCAELSIDSSSSVGDIEADSSFFNIQDRMEHRVQLKQLQIGNSKHPLQPREPRHDVALELQMWQGQTPDAPATVNVVLWQQLLIVISPSMVASLAELGAIASSLPLSAPHSQGAVASKLNIEAKIQMPWVVLTTSDDTSALALGGGWVQFTTTSSEDGSALDETDVAELRVFGLSIAMSEKLVSLAEAIDEADMEAAPVFAHCTDPTLVGKLRTLSDKSSCELRLRAMSIELTPADISRGLHLATQFGVAASGAGDCIQSSPVRAANAPSTDAVLSMSGLVVSMRLVKESDQLSSNSHWLVQHGCDGTERTVRERPDFNAFISDLSLSAQSDPVHQRILVKVTSVMVKDMQCNTMLFTGCGTTLPWARVLLVSGERNHQACVVCVDTIQSTVNMQSVVTALQIHDAVCAQMPPSVSMNKHVTFEHSTQADCHKQHDNSSPAHTQRLRGLIRVKGISLSLQGYTQSRPREKLATCCVGRISIWPKITPEYSKCELTVSSIQMGPTSQSCHPVWLDINTETQPPARSLGSCFQALRQHAVDNNQTAPPSKDPIWISAVEQDGEMFVAAQVKQVAVIVLAPAVIQLMFQVLPPAWLQASSTAAPVVTPAAPATIVSFDLSVRNVHVIVPVHAHTPEHLEIRLQRVKLVKCGPSQSPVKRHSPINKKPPTSPEGLNASVLLATLNAVEKSLFSPEVSQSNLDNEIQVAVVGLRIGCVLDGNVHHSLIRHFNMTASHKLSSGTEVMNLQTTSVLRVNFTPNHVAPLAQLAVYQSSEMFDLEERSGQLIASVSFPTIEVEVAGCSGPLCLVRCYALDIFCDLEPATTAMSANLASLQIDDCTGGNDGQLLLTTFMPKSAHSVTPVQQKGWAKGLRGSTGTPTQGSSWSRGHPNTYSPLQNTSTPKQGSNRLKANVSTPLQNTSTPTQSSNWFKTDASTPLRNTVTPTQGGSWFNSRPNGSTPHTQPRETSAGFCSLKYTAAADMDCAEMLEIKMGKVDLYCSIGMLPMWSHALYEFGAAVTAAHNSPYGSQSDTLETTSAFPAEAQNAQPSSPPAILCIKYEIEPVRAQVILNDALQLCLQLGTIQAHANVMADLTRAELYVPDLFVEVSSTGVRKQMLRLPFVTLAASLFCEDSELYPGYPAFIRGSMGAVDLDLKQNDLSEILNTLEHSSQVVHGVSSTVAFSAEAAAIEVGQQQHSLPLIDFAIEQIAIGFELLDHSCLTLRVGELKVDTALEMIQGEPCLALGIALGSCELQLPPDPQHHGAFGAAIVFSSCTVQGMLDTVFSSSSFPLQNIGTRVCGLSLSLQPLGSEDFEGSAHEVSTNIVAPFEMSISVLPECEDGQVVLLHISISILKSTFHYQRESIACLMRITAYYVSILNNLTAQAAPEASIESCTKPPLALAIDIRAQYLSLILDRVIDLHEHPYLWLKLGELLLELHVDDVFNLTSVQACVRLLVGLDFFNDRLTWDPVIEQCQIAIDTAVHPATQALSFSLTALDPFSVNLCPTFVHSALDPSWQPPPIDQFSADTSGLEEVLLVNQLPCSLTYLTYYDSESGQNKPSTWSGELQACTRHVLCDESTRQRMSLLFRLSSDCHGAPRDSEGNALHCVSEEPFYGTAPLNHTHVVPLACTIPGSTTTVPSERRSICIDYLFKQNQKCAHIVVYAKHIFVNRSGLDLRVFWGGANARALDARSAEPLILSDFDESNPALQIVLFSDSDCKPGSVVFQVPLGIETMVGNAVDITLKDADAGVQHQLLCWVELGYGKCYMSKAIHLVPRMTVINQLDLPVWIDGKQIILEQAQAAVVPQLGAGHSKMLEIRVQGYQPVTAHVSAEHAGCIVCGCRAELAGNAPLLLRLSLTHTTGFQMNIAAETKAPYTVLNRHPTAALTFYQAHNGPSATREIVGPGCSFPFVWDQNDSSSELVLVLSLPVPNSTIAWVVLEDGADLIGRLKTGFIYQIEANLYAYPIARYQISGTQLHRTIVVSAVPGNPPSILARCREQHCWELERRDGASECFHSNLDAERDPPAFCTDELQPASVQPGSDAGLPAHSSWAGAWEVHTPGICGDDGWHYQSTSFVPLRLDDVRKGRTQKGCAFAAQWAPVCTSATMVRRRRWTRLVASPAEDSSEDGSTTQYPLSPSHAAASTNRWRVQITMSIPVVTICCLCFDPLEELMRISIGHLWLQHKVRKSRSSCEVSLDRLQVDNQGACRYAVVFSFDPTAAQTPCRVQVHWELVRANQTEFLIKVSHASLELEPMRVAIEEQFLWQLVAWFSSVVPNSWTGASQPAAADPQPLRRTPQRLLIEALQISPINIVLSFAKNGMRGSWGRASDVMYAVANLTCTPLNFGAFSFRKASVGITPGMLVESMVKWYQQQLLQTVHLLIGSADAIGNPVQFVKSLEQAVLSLSPWTNRGGIPDPGAACRHLLQGLTGVSMNLAKVTARTNATLSLDPAYLSWRETDRQQFEASMLAASPEGATGMRHMGHGMERLRYSIGEAVMGITALPSTLWATGWQPYDAVQGVVRASIGLVTKPVAGIMDIAAGVAQDVHQAVKQINSSKQLGRVRKPQQLGSVQQAGSPIRAATLVADDSVGPVSQIWIGLAEEPVPSGLKVLRDGSSGEVALLRGAYAADLKKAVQLVILFQTSVHRTDCWISSIELVPVRMFPDPSALEELHFHPCASSSGALLTLKTRGRGHCWLCTRSELRAAPLTSILLEPTEQDGMLQGYLDTQWQPACVGDMHVASDARLCRVLPDTGGTKWSSVLVRQGWFLFHPSRGGDALRSLELPVPCTRTPYQQYCSALDQLSLPAPHVFCRPEILLPICEVLMAPEHLALKLEREQGFIVIRSTLVGTSAALAGGSRTQPHYLCYLRSDQSQAVSAICCSRGLEPASELQLQVEKGGDRVLLDLQVVRTAACSRRWGERTSESASHGYELLQFTRDGHIANLCRAQQASDDHGLFVGVHFGI